MKDDERIELLKAVAECAPKEWKAEYVPGTACVSWIRMLAGKKYTAQQIFLSLLDDVDDGRAIIAMCDAMEGAGCDPVLERGGCFGERVRYYVCLVRREGEAIADRQGSTRAEAVARAFVAVFSLTEVPQP